MSLSSFTFSGIVKKAPEKRFTPTNIAVANFLVEVCFALRASQSGSGNISSQTIRVTAWRDLAEECEKSLKEGDRVLIIGRAQINAYTTTEGKKKREVEVDATSVTKIENILSVKAPPKQEDTTERPKAKKEIQAEEIQNIEEITSLDEAVASAEEIPF